MKCRLFFNFFFEPGKVGFSVVGSHNINLKLCQSDTYEYFPPLLTIKAKAECLSLNSTQTHRERELETKVLVVSSVVGFLGLLSTVLGFAAEGQRIKGSQVTQNVNSPSICIYPRSPAFGLGLTAALSLLVAQIIVNVASGCVCCCKRYVRPSNSRCHCTLAVMCFVVSWCTFALAFVLLLGAAALNDQHNMDSMYLNYYCYVVKPGVFASAAALSFVSVALGLFYYLSLTSGKTGTVGPSMLPTSQPNGIAINAMGRPEVPPTSQDPVFVHEDTYVRRQFT